MPPNSFLIALRYNFAPKFGGVVAPKCGYFTSGRRSKRPSTFKFCQNEKNLLWDELNVLKWNLNVNIKNTIADYRFKSSMFGQNDWSMTSGRKLAD